MAINNLDNTNSLPLSSPFRSGGGFGVTHANELIGGLHHFNTIAERDAMYVERQQTGMRGYVAENNTYYDLKNSDNGLVWVVSDKNYIKKTGEINQFIEGNLIMGTFEFVTLSVRRGGIPLSTLSIDIQGHHVDLLRSLTNENGVLRLTLIDDLNQFVEIDAYIEDYQLNVFGMTVPMTGAIELNNKTRFDFVSVSGNWATDLNIEIQTKGGTLFTHTPIGVLTASYGNLIASTENLISKGGNDFFTDTEKQRVTDLETIADDTYRKSESDDRHYNSLDIYKGYGNEAVINIPGKYSNNMRFRVGERSIVNYSYDDVNKKYTFENHHGGEVIVESVLVGGRDDRRTDNNYLYLYKDLIGLKFNNPTTNNTSTILILGTTQSVAHDSSLKSTILAVYPAANVIITTDLTAATTYDFSTVDIVTRGSTPIVAPTEDNMLQHGTLYVSPSGSNTFEDLSNEGNEGFYNNLIITASADPTNTNNATSYTTGLEFIDYDSYHMNEPLQSWSAAVITAKLLKIKDSLSFETTWNHIREACRLTASYKDNYTIQNGFGVIDVDAAVDYLEKGNSTVELGNAWVWDTWTVTGERSNASTGSILSFGNGQSIYFSVPDDCEIYMIVFRGEITGENSFDLIEQDKETYGTGKSNTTVLQTLDFSNTNDGHIVEFNQALQKGYGYNVEFQSDNINKITTTFCMRKKRYLNFD